MTYQCRTCGKTHEGLPDIGFRWPDPYFGEDFFIRGVILIPVREQEKNFGIGVWVSQKRENFETYMKNYDTPSIGPFFGWLSNRRYRLATVPERSVGT